MRTNDPVRAGTTPGSRRGRSFPAPGAPGGRSAIAAWHRERIDPDGAEERVLRGLGHRLVAGVDEVGRGCLAGPVVAGAVILEPGWLPRGLRDSKLLKREERERLAAEIRAHAVAWGIGIVEPGLIDRMNILQATLLASQVAIARLAVRPDALLLDALDLPHLHVAQRALVDADRLCVSVAAASVVAKVARDRLMDDYDVLYPAYGFVRNRGYAAPEHRAAIVAHGPSPIHRRSFLGAYAIGDVDQSVVRPDDEG
jgi:ribonuclease HII